MFTTSQALFLALEGLNLKTKARKLGLYFKSDGKPPTVHSSPSSSAVLLPWFQLPMVNCSLKIQY